MVFWKNSLQIKDNWEIYKCNFIISRCYTYIIFSIIIVEYDEYILLLVGRSNV